MHQVGDGLLSDIEVGDRALVELTEFFPGERQEASVVLRQHFGGDRGETVLHRVPGVFEDRQFLGGVAPLGLETGRQSGLRLLRRGQGHPGRA